MTGKGLLAEVMERINKVELGRFDENELDPMQPHELVIGKVDEDILRIHVAIMEVHKELMESVSHFRDIDIHGNVEELLTEVQRIPEVEWAEVRRLIDDKLFLLNVLNYLFSMSVARKCHLEPGSECTIRRNGIIVVPNGSYHN